MMPRNEDGEFELILGNRQLLSVFFIVVILLGVFFTMGYIVGRSSSPIGSDVARKDKPMIVDPANRPAPSVSPAPTSEAATPPPEPVREHGTAAAEEPKPQAGKPVEKAPQAASVPGDQPAPGETYLQVAAVQKAEAELFVDVLAKKGFHSVYAMVPGKQDTYRVLVGPLKDVSAIAQARTDLQKAGFKCIEALVRKY
jgi:cell division septation protein DedD